MVPLVARPPTRRARVCFDGECIYPLKCPSTAICWVVDLSPRHLQRSEKLDPRVLQWLGDRTGVAVAGDPDGTLIARVAVVL